MSWISAHQMSDDIFSQLFNLFNNDDGDVNWNLASQINNHINKEAEESFLFSNSEMNYEEIFRAIQLNNQSLDNPYEDIENLQILNSNCLLYTSPSPRDGLLSRMPSSA